MILEPGSDAAAGETHVDIDGFGSITADYCSDNKRYLVLEGRTRRHRICMNGVGNDHGLVARMPFDSSYGARSIASERLYRLISGLPSQRPQTVLEPTRYQRARFVQLLQLLDAKDAGLSRRVAAFATLYPHSKPLSNAEWKASHERRRTYRMLEIAHKYCASGYRTLLLAHPAGF